MSELVLTERRGFVLEIRLNRPEKRNALTTAMYEALIAAFEAAARDPAIRVLLIVGNGEGFTAGNDLKEFLALAGGGEPAAYRFIRLLARNEKPLVAAVQGAAVGLGTTLLLHCDLVVAARNARFQLPFVDLGLVPEAAATLLLPRLVGPARAAELLLLGEAFDADQALEFGLVNRVVEDGAELEAAQDLAQRLAGRPPEAVRQTRALLRRDAGQIEQRMAEEKQEFIRRLASPELREAATAFLEKRKPDWSKLG